MSRLRVVSKASWANATPSNYSGYIDPLTPPVISGYSVSYGSNGLGYGVAPLQVKAGVTGLPGMLDLLNAPAGFNGAGYRKGLYLCKGTPPSAADVAQWGYCTTNTSSEQITQPWYLIQSVSSMNVFRYTDVLVGFGINSASLVSNTIALTLAQATASATGTATWFCLYAVPGYNSNQSAHTYPFIIAGTVSTVNGGGDVEVPNVAITSGNIYKLPQFELKLPFNYVA